jgi:hypothetical protein
MLVLLPPSMLMMIRSSIAGPDRLSTVARPKAQFR